MKKYLIPLISITIGICLWTSISLITGESEAWDSPLYFKVGFPIFILLNFFLGIIEPKKPWRWGLLSTISQIIPLAVMSIGTGNMWPLGLIFMLILSIPTIIVAYIGSFLGKKLFSHKNGI